MPKKQYVVKSAVEHDNERFEPGSKITLDDTAAEALLLVNAIGADTGESDSSGELVEPTDAKERLVAITAAIAALDKGNTDQWLKDGKPSSEAITAVVGWPVTAAERNTAWAGMQPAV